MMIVRLLVNAVRWSWGLPSYDFVGNLGDSTLELLMFFGAIIDAISLVVVVILVGTFIDEMRRTKK